jgi:hypothetical protein
MYSLGYVFCARGQCFDDTDYASFHQYSSSKKNLVTDAGFYQFLSEVLNFALVDEDSLLIY